MYPVITRAGLSHPPYPLCYTMTTWLPLIHTSWDEIPLKKVIHDLFTISLDVVTQPTAFNFHLVQMLFSQVRKSGSCQVSKESAT